LSGGGEAVDLGLHPNMRRSFELLYTRAILVKR